MKKRKVHRGFWRRIPLADKLLLAFMAVLLVQSGHNLFANELGRGDSTELDVVVRTTAAAVFGYFISTGVQRQGESSAPTARTKIGFAIGEEQQTSARMEAAEASVGTEEAPLPPYEEEAESGRRRLDQQMWIVGLIGLISLGFLIMARNWGQSSPEAMAALSQLRDFVSGSVGFLIAHGGGASKM